MSGVYSRKTADLNTIPTIAGHGVHGKTWGRVIPPYLPLARISLRNFLALGNRR